MSAYSIILPIDEYAGILPSHSFRAHYGLLCIATAFTFAGGPPQITWLTANLRNTGALTLGVPMIISLGGIGQIIGKNKWFLDFFRC